MLKAYNHATGLGYQSKRQQVTREAEEIPGQLTPLDIRHASEAVPGTWMAFRNFNSEKTPDNSHGLSGHVAMVLGPGSDNQVVTLGYSRHMPEKEGFGVESFPVINNAVTRTLFFRKKNMDESDVDVRRHLGLTA